MRQTIILIAFLAAVLMLVTTGCGMETSQANDLVAEADEIDIAAEAKLVQIDTKMSQA